MTDSVLPPVSRRAVLGGAVAGTAAAAVGVPGAAALGIPGAADAALAAGSVALDDRMTGDRAWRDFLSPLDPTWSTMPTSFYQAPFLGNGGLGACAYQVDTAKRLSFKLGDTRVRDHQSAGGVLFGGARLPIGHLTLDTLGDVTAVDLRLSLWDAELRGTVTTTQGVLGLRAYVHASRDLLVIAATALSGAERIAYTFTPAVARSPRLDFYAAPTGLATNPAPTTTATTCVQDLAAGGRTATAWSLRTEADTYTRTLLLTVAHSHPGNGADTTAASTLTDAAGRSLNALTGEHRAWWHGFYPRSFVSVSDTRMQSFYWLQLYKMASATRSDRPVLSTIGPWLEKTPWPATWWNLNVQLEYWLINATGHPELDSLSGSFDRYAANLAANVPSTYPDSAVIARTSQEDLLSGAPAMPGAASGTPEVGNLIWALHNAWLSYRHSMDDTVLRNRVFPLLRKAVNFYRNFLTRDAAGVYHLPTTYSPEYASTADCNYDLALISWGCSTLLAANARLGLNDSLAPIWQDIRDHLVAPPADAGKGLRIGRDVALTTSHRHYSHLLWFYPLYLLTSDADRQTLRDSLATWLGFTGAQQGYTFTGSGSMYAFLGDGAKAHTQLTKLLDTFIQPNTMYKESGPVIETPLSGAQTMHDMLVQSWGDRIRVFPAVPTAWADATVHNLRTEGGFQISAAHRGGVTRFVRVRSDAGEPCRVAPGNLPGPFEVRRVNGTAPVTWRQESDGSLTLTLVAGDDVVITTQGANPALTIDPAVTPARTYYGLPPAGTPVFVDLTAVYNRDGISDAVVPADGDLDNSGYTYPAEELPGAGLFTSGDTSFRFPSSAPGAKNTVVPAGQKITVTPGAYRELHVLGAGVSGDASGTVTLHYGDGTTGSATLNLTDWGRSAAYGEQTAVVAGYRHGRTGDNSLRVRIWHQDLAVDPARTLTAVTLPNSSRMRLVALTLTT
ncbi:Tat pathway signal sequence domain protein [Longispora sp. K20-0274]|uniref:glycosyl hydrolase family 95 catalytic domain-containing protein n=1 Tax=Longispora sp. K20-0274 TaxID=3088255 RepID=UPI003999F994